MGSTVINIAELAERLDSDYELFVELAELFNDDSASLLERIENAIKNRDNEGLRKAAHTLKGAVANFSAPAAYEAASILEQTGKNPHLDGAEEQFEQLKSEINAVIAEMKKISQAGSF